jgi:hypothetical protein
MVSAGISILQKVDPKVCGPKGAEVHIISLLQAGAAGADGIRQERPHLDHVLEAHDCVQVCVPAARPVSCLAITLISTLATYQFLNASKCSFCYAGLLLT